MEKKRTDFEQSILKRVALVLWGIILLIIIMAMMFKGAHNGDFREAVMSATSAVTQIYITEPNFGPVIFVFGFIGKVLIIYIVYILILLFNEGVFKKSLEEGRIMKNIGNLKDHYIICGGGRVGGRVAEDLMKAKKGFVIIDKDVEAVEMFNKRKMPAIAADSLDDAALTLANITKAKALISCLDREGDNMLQIIVAKKLNGKIKIVARANHEKFIANMKNVGADEVIIPELIGGKEIAESAMRL